MDTTIVVTHALYEPYRLTTGSGPTGREMMELLQEADRALERSSGWFFRTIDDRFVIGKLTEWKPAHGAHREGDFFYNVFTFESERATGVELNALVEELSNYVVADPDADAWERSEVAVPAPSTVDEEPLRVVADVWEQWQTDGTVRATLAEISTFVRHVEGALQHLKFVSRDANEGGYFDVVGDRSREIGTGDDLLPAIRRLADERDELHFDDLRSIGEDAGSEPVADDHATITPHERSVIERCLEAGFATDDGRSDVTAIELLDRRTESSTDEIVLEEAYRVDYQGERTTAVVRVQVPWDGTKPRRWLADDARPSATVDDTSDGNGGPRLPLDSDLVVLLVVVLLQLVTLGLLVGLVL